jgi:hypothetical protein
MKGPDEPRPPVVKIPSPEQLGLAPAAASAVDWATSRGKLGKMGATCFQLDRAPTGGYRFTCWLPAETAGKSYRVEADGGDEAEAVRLCLERAERWVRR